MRRRAKGVVNDTREGHQDLIELRGMLRSEPATRSEEDLAWMAQWFIRNISKLESEFCLEQITAICQHLKYAKVPAGQQICEQGDVAHDMYLILTGSVAISVAGLGDICKLGAGELFGALDLLAGHAGDREALNVRCASATTDHLRTTTELAVLDQDSFDATMRPQLALSRWVLVMEHEADMRFKVPPAAGP
jgi:hypothetical protein